MLVRVLGRAIGPDHQCAHQYFPSLPVRHPSDAPYLAPTCPQMKAVMGPMGIQVSNAVRYDVGLKYEGTCEERVQRIRNATRDHLVSLMVAYQTIVPNAGAYHVPIVTALKVHGAAVRRAVPFGVHAPAWLVSVNVYPTAHCTAAGVGLFLIASRQPNGRVAVLLTDVHATCRTGHGVELGTTGDPCHDGYLEVSTPGTASYFNATCTAGACDASAPHCTAGVVRT